LPTAVAIYFWDKTISGVVDISTKIEEPEVVNMGIAITVPPVCDT